MNPEELLGALRALLQARSEVEARQVLQEHPELLDEEVDLLLQQLASQARQDGDAKLQSSSPSGESFCASRDHPEPRHTLRMNRSSPRYCKSSPGQLS